MSNSTLSTKLFGFINSQMTDFLSVIAKDYKINETEILDKWSSFTGIKKKTSKPKSTGPTIIELRQKLKGIGLKSSGKKSDLEERLIAFGKVVNSNLSLPNKRGKAPLMVITLSPHYQTVERRTQEKRSQD